MTYISDNLHAAIMLTAVLAGAVPAAEPQRAAAASVDVFKSPTCGCCSKWVDHMRKAGFTMHVEDLADADLQKLKMKFGVPASATSCHTARIGGYVIEGHVPAADIKRLLRQRPKVAGLAVPGMPLGSPGMEVPGRRAQPYDVLSFDKRGKTERFSTQKP